MKFSERWLREWVNPNVTTEQLVDRLTMLGLEIDSVTPAAPAFSGVVVGSVLSVAPHPNADTLHCCRVQVAAQDAHPHEIDLICGAKNVRVGLKVAVAREGAVLPNQVVIKKTEIRGLPSSDMLCSAKELGLFAAEQAGIMELPDDAPIGCDLREYLQLDDQIIDIELTPNRGDCLSINGIAREVSVAYEIPLNEAKPINKEYPRIDDQIPIYIEAPRSCPRYVGRIIRCINENAVTPLWMQERLRRSGLRPVLPVVDVTNYVMLELGQPLHAFDLDALDTDKSHKEIHVRLAAPGEHLHLLDGRQVELQADTLVIADTTRPQAIAGLMGGISSAVTERTHHVFLESAYFDPIYHSLTTRCYGIQSDASYRFVRGVDFNLPVKAIERATELLLSIVGGEVGPICEQSSVPDLPKQSVVKLRREQIKRLLGIEMADQRVETILRALNMEVLNQMDGWQVTVPSNRFDLNLEVDIIEEIARIYGFDQIPSHAMIAPLYSQVRQSEQQVPMMRILDCLVDRGYHEAITYSFVDPKLEKLLNPQQETLTLLNPLSSDMSVMRTTLWSGLLQTLRYNYHHQHERVRLFEVGTCFYPLENTNDDQSSSSEEQKNLLAGIVTGSVYPKQWGLPDKAADFFDVKGDLQALFALTGIDDSLFTWEPAQHPALHPGQSARIKIEEQTVGIIGVLHPNLIQPLDIDIIPTSIILFEVDLQAIMQARLPQYSAISKFPDVQRDIAFCIDQVVPVASILTAITNNAGNLLKNIQLFDVYQGQGIEKGKKSIALRLTFQDISRTLIEVEVNEVIDNILKLLQHEFHAALRV